MKNLMSEIHELNVNIIELAGQISGLKKYVIDVKERVVWVQQNLGLRRMPKKRRGPEEEV